MMVLVFVWDSAQFAVLVYHSKGLVNLSTANPLSLALDEATWWIETLARGVVLCLCQLCQSELGSKNTVFVQGVQNLLIYLFISN